MQGILSVSKIAPGAIFGMNPHESIQVFAAGP